VYFPPFEESTKKGHVEGSRDIIVAAGSFSVTVYTGDHGPISFSFQKFGNSITEVPRGHDVQIAICWQTIPTLSLQLHREKHTAIKIALNGIQCTRYNIHNYRSLKYRLSFQKNVVNLNWRLVTFSYFSLVSAGNNRLTGSPLCRNLRIQSTVPEEYYTSCI
jgi:hypothetical protein